MAHNLEHFSNNILSNLLDNLCCNKLEHFSRDIENNKLLNIKKYHQNIYIQHLSIYCLYYVMDKQLAINGLYYCNNCIYYFLH